MEQSSKNVNNWFASFVVKKDAVLVAVLVALALGSSVFALSISNFSDYSPPDYLYIHWYDYMINISNAQPTVNNAVSEFPRWSAEYPYRAIFLGGTPSKDIQYYIVYSKVPSTDLFTFTYSSGDKSQYQLGRIRLYMPSNKVGVDDSKDFRVIRVGHDVSGQTAYISSSDYEDFSVTRSGIGTSGSNVYFSFDFYYDCASEHQQGALDFNISGVTNISGVPYDYIIHCLNHTGHTGGGGSSGGGGSGLPWSGNPPGFDPDPSVPGSSLPSGIDYRKYPDPKDSPPEWTPKPLNPTGSNPDPYPWEKTVPPISLPVPTPPPFVGIGDGDDGKPIEFPVSPPAPFIPFPVNPPDFPSNLPPPIITFPLDPWFGDAWPPTFK